MAILSSPAHAAHPTAAASRTPRAVLSYAAVTPARDEEDNLSRLADSLLAQSVRPARWVIVENGSRDGTLALAHRLGAEHPWVRVVQSEPGSGYDRTSPYMRAFHAGVDALEGVGDLVVKLDADVSMGPEYFAGVLAAFAEDPRLGIASGTLLEERHGQWRECILLGNHCWGPTRTYRRECLSTVLPLNDGLNYATVDETKAALAGFGTRTLQCLPFYHHRPEGAGEGSSWSNWCKQGVAVHHMGYRLSYLIARCLYRLPADRAALGLIVGYVGALAQRRARYADREVVDALRERQRARHFRSIVRSRLRRAHGAQAGHEPNLLIDQPAS